MLQDTPVKEGDDLRVCSCSHKRPVFYARLVALSSAEPNEAWHLAREAAFLTNVGLRTKGSTSLTRSSYDYLFVLDRLRLLFLRPLIPEWNCARSIQVSVRVCACACACVCAWVCNFLTAPVCLWPRV